MRVCNRSAKILVNYLAFTENFVCYFTCSFRRCNVFSASSVASCIFFSMIRGCSTIYTPIVCTTVHCSSVLWNRNYFLRFRFRLLTILRFRFHIKAIKSTIFQKLFGKNLAFLHSKLFTREKIDKFH
jgi:hypothetical protein